MKTLLHHTTGNLYIQSPDQWTPDAELALDFRFPDRALKFAQTWELKEVDLALVFDEPRRISLVPLDQCRAPSRRA